MRNFATMDEAGREWRVRRPEHGRSGRAVTLTQVKTPDRPQVEGWKAAPGGTCGIPVACGRDPRFAGIEGWLGDRWERHLTSQPK
jgi:hypothetical protein